MAAPTHRLGRDAALHRTGLPPALRGLRAAPWGLRCARARTLGWGRAGAVACALMVLVAAARPGWCALPPIAPLTGPVMDEAGMLSLPDAERLRERLLALQQRTGAQLVFASVADLQDEPIEDRAVRMAEAWRVGSKKSDDGLLLVVAPNARRVRLEVGYGLEGILPDAVANRLIAATLSQSPRGMDGPAVLALSERLCSLIEASAPTTTGTARARGVPTPLMEPAMASALLGIALGLVATWFTIGRWFFRRLPFRPLRPPPGPYGRRPTSSTEFKQSLWRTLLLALLAGRGRRGGRGGNDDDQYRGGGGGFGGGGASGRW